MLLDGRELPNGAVLETGCAIIGGGAAGITLARVLAVRGVDTVLIESGGTEFDSETQALYEGVTSGSAYWGLQETRLRFLGGTTNHWGGWCRPLDAIDFEPRDWIRYSGWPITRADLMPYYEAAQPICELGTFGYDALPSRPGASRFAGGVDTADIRTGVFQFSPPTRFAARYADDLRSTPGLTCLLESNVIGFETNETGGRVTALLIACLHGPAFKVRARVYVLAAGGIENARLLLLPTRTRPGGVGNHHDLAGRFFMDHPIVSDAATLVVRAPEGLDPLFDDQEEVEGAVIRACLAPTERYLRTARRLNFLATLGPVARYGADNQRVGLGETELGPQTGYRLLRITKSLEHRNPNVAMPSAAWATVYSVGISCEVQPDRDNRVTLSDDKDALGVPRVHLHWRPSPVDRASLHAGLMAIGQAITRQRIGRFRLLLSDAEAWPEDVFWGCHHSGTTRMSRTASSGVVDSNCRVHSLDNVYVAGSSLFPTAGAANPTLTIIALCLRLADLLTDRLT